MSIWRVGARVKLNVYEDDQPVCQCHTEENARRIVEAMNSGPSVSSAVYYERQRCFNAAQEALKLLSDYNCAQVVISVMNKIRSGK